MPPILQLNDVSGGYSLRRPVLHDLSFQVEPGEIVGLLGLNGAGKSTTMKHILGIMKPHKGEIFVNQTTLAQSPETYRASYAYVPETPVLYDEMTVEEHLQLTRMAYGISEADYNARKKELLADFNMEEKADRFPHQLSKGMKQKVMIMCAFMARPPLYIIDEPFLGLDPLGIRSLLDRMARVREAGSSILMSSHILSMLEGYCDRYIVLHHGRKIACGTLQELRMQVKLPNASLDELFYLLIKGDASS